MRQIKIKNEVENKVFDEVTQEYIQKEQLVIEAEEAVLLENKRVEVQGKLNTYKAAQQNQLQNGGPGPVSSIEIMTIVNEHNSEFEVIFS